ncbi:DUF1206 domain-containing protein [Corallococcus llansteffanensis]|uniref:DUF1206 domain-containing protein n=1 Tax=Corallococcus llansteffanensis TaxID=2316731 RepID=A0A3A8Q9K1_9BACT|nr:DUF1206 domain-containing protein [Corallococcus llansteffanensis]RKH59954.1 DUF1206 domain-containing protein [Corallococcus llansteffanensis]
MTTMDVMRGPGMERLSQGAKQAASHPWAKKLGRMGYAAKGAVYAIIGVLALKLAAGQGGRTTDSHGAVDTVAHGPFGLVLLSVLVVGLLGFVVWRFAQAFADTEEKGSDGKGLAARAMYFLSGAIYASLALFAAKMVVGASQGRGKGTQGWTATLMEQPFGRVLVALVGLGILGFAVKQFHKAWKGKFLEKLTLTGLAAQQRHWVERVSRFGIAARGMVFAVIGIFLVRSAVDANPGEAKGLGEALAVVARQPAGDVLLGVVAAGLVAYAAYMVLQARYRRL